MSTVWSRLLDWLRRLVRGSEGGWVEPSNEITRLVLGGPISLPTIRRPLTAAVTMVGQAAAQPVAAAPIPVASEPDQVPPLELAAIRQFVVDESLDDSQPLAFPGRAA